MTVLKSSAIWLVSLILIWILNPILSDYTDPYIFSIIIYAGINVILAVSLNLVNGITGQFSMGHAGFMAVGAYVSAFLSILIKSHSPELFSNPVTEPFVFIAVLMAGGCLAAVAGYLVGLPSLRLRGDYLAIVTLGFGEIIRVIILNMNSIGGARGLPDIPQLSSFGWVFTWMLITIFAVHRLMGTSWGRSFLAVREDEIAAEAMGVSTTNAKVRAFVIGAFFSGIAGGLFGHFLQYLNPSIFDFNRSFEFIIMVVLGGMGSISGAVIAAIFLTVSKEALRLLYDLVGVDLRMIIYSLLLIALMLLRPNGLFGTKEIFDFIPGLKPKRRGEKSEASL